MNKSIQLDPFNPPVIFAYASILMFSDRLEQCKEQLDKLFKITPQFPDATYLKGFLYQQRGEYQKAKSLFIEIRSIPGLEIMADGSLGCLYLTMNQRAKTNEILENLLETERTTPNSKAPFNIALIYAAMDKPDEMFRFLAKSVEQKDNSVVYILGYSAFKKFRSDPRFTEIVKKIGLWK